MVGFIVDPDQRVRDLDRQKVLEGLGIRVVRVRAGDVERRLPAVLDVLRRAALTPDPSPDFAGEGSHRQPIIEQLPLSRSSGEGAGG